MEARESLRCIYKDSLAEKAKGVFVFHNSVSRRWWGLSEHVFPQVVNRTDWIEESLRHISPCGSLHLRLLISVWILSAHVKTSPTFHCDFTTAALSFFPLSLRRLCFSRQTHIKFKFHPSSLLLSAVRAQEESFFFFEGGTYVATCK